MTKSSNTNIRVFRTPGEMNESVAQLLTRVGREAIAARGRFALCLTGGNTPRELYALLSGKPYSETVPWNNTWVFWVDERCVPENDERNNARMTRSLLLDKTAIPPGQVFPIPVSIPPEEAALRYEMEILKFFGTEPPRFDLVLLGLGADGHTASLFPGTDVLGESSRLVREVFVEKLQMYRITLTAPLINQARCIIFLVRGEEKSCILDALSSAPYEPGKYPAQLIRPENGEVYWFADQEAASGLSL